MTHAHARAAVLAAGDELSLGQKIDTNSAWIADRLSAVGIIPVEHTTVPDDLGAHAAALRRLAGEVDLIISTGGLGPTADDLTRHALADAMGDALVEDPRALGEIRAWFERRSRSMPAINALQALRPSRAMALSNANGTAPGLHALITCDGKACDVFCLPGPPAEMEAMFEASVRPGLRPPPGRAVRTRSVHTFGLGESELAMRLAGLMRRSGGTIVGTTASGGIVTVRIRSADAGSPERADAELDRVEREVRRVAGEFVFGTGDETLASAVVGRLRAAGANVAVAESCTGGHLGRLITDVPGASDVFAGGWIVYGNDLKRRALGIPPAVIDTHGAVSAEVAMAMACAARERAGTTHALGVTGIAGPDGGSADKPVGTVWIGLDSAGELPEARRFLMVGDRASIREWSGVSALGALRLRLERLGATGLLREVERR